MLTHFWVLGLIPAALFGLQKHWIKIFHNATNTIISLTPLLVMSVSYKLHVGSFLFYDTCLYLQGYPYDVISVTCLSFIVQHVMKDHYNY